MPRFVFKPRNNPRRYRRTASRFIALQRKWKRRRVPLRRKVRNLAKKVNKDIEHRWLDTINYSFSIPGSGGSMEPLGLETISTTPTAGLNNDRLGNKITLKSIYIKGQVITADTHNFMRLILVKTISLNQIVICSDILEPDPASSNPTIYSPYRKESRIKYQVLLDKMYKTQQQAAGSVYPFLLNVDMSYKFKKGLTITYNQAGASVPIYNNVYLLCLSDSALPTHPQFRGAKRLTWIA